MNPLARRSSALSWVIPPRSTTRAIAFALLRTPGLGNIPILVVGDAESWQVHQCKARREHRRVPADLQALDQRSEVASGVVVQRIAELEVGDLSLPEVLLLRFGL